MSIRILPNWWAQSEKFWKKILSQDSLSSLPQIPHSWKNRFKRGELDFHEAVLFVLSCVLVFLISPLRRRKNMVGLVLASIGLGLLSQSLYDSRIVLFSVTGLLAFSYPVVMVILVMSIALPWWFSMLGFLSFARTKLLKNSWVLSIGLSLAFFYMFF